MIRNHQSETHSAKSSAPKNSTACWMEATRPNGVRFELDEHRFFIFPYTYLVSAEFTTEAGGDELTLTFNSKEVRVNGRDLRDLALSFQKQTAEWVRVIHAHYAALVAVDAPLVLAITVKAQEEGRDPIEWPFPVGS